MIRPAISSGSPRRPSGICGRILAGIPQMTPELARILLLFLLPWKTDARCGRLPAPSGSPNGGRVADLAIFPGLGTVRSGGIALTMSLCSATGTFAICSNSPSRARRVRFGPPDRLSPSGEVYLQPTLTTGHWTGEGGSRERGGEKMVWEPDRFNARVAHRLRGRPRFELIKARDLESLATA